MRKSFQRNTYYILCRKRAFLWLSYHLEIKNHSDFGVGDYTRLAGFKYSVYYIIFPANYVTLLMWNINAVTLVAHSHCHSGLEINLWATCSYIKSIVGAGVSGTQRERKRKLKKKKKSLLKLNPKINNDLNSTFSTAGFTATYSTGEDRTMLVAMATIRCCKHCILCLFN